MRRRAFLKSGALSVLSLGWGGVPLFMTRTARAASPPGLYKRPKTLVALFQRGAMDGLMAVTPFRDPALAKLRPRLAMSVGQSGRNASLIDLDERFGLHPAFASWLPLYREGQLGIIHGVGSPNPTRSHFDAQDYMETGLPFRKGAHSGWLNRAVGLTGHESDPVPGHRPGLLHASLTAGSGARSGSLGSERVSDSGPRRGSPERTFRSLTFSGCTTRPLIPCSAMPPAKPSKRQSYSDDSTSLTIKRAMARPILDLHSDRT